MADGKKVEKKHGIFDDEEYVSDDEPDEGEILEARLHPELRVELKRFGLVILPYQQRTWYWELFSMMNKLLLAMTATFFSRSPKLQMQLMLAQNTTWLALLLFFRPFCAVPFKGGPMERFFADVGRGELKAHWSAGNIVEVAMACGSVTISAMGVSVASGETDPAAGSSVFFIQLFVILVFIGRALQTAGNSGSSFFGAGLTAAWVAGREVIMGFLVRMGIIKKRKKDEKKVVAKVKAQKSEAARERWAKLRAESGLSAAANDLRKQPMLVQMAMEAKRRSAHARNVLNRSGSSVSASMSKWINEGRGEKEDEEEDLLPEAPPGKIAVGAAKLLIRFSPVFLFVFLAIPIAITSLTASYGFTLDSTMDAFNIRDHPAAESFTTFVNARDRSRDQRDVNHYVTPDCVPDTPVAAARRKLMEMDDETQMHAHAMPDADFAKLYANATDEEHLSSRKAGRGLLQASDDYTLSFCDRMRVYLFYSSRDGTTLLNENSLLDIKAADDIIRAHPKYERFCAKWTTPTGDVQCIPPHSLASYFFPEYSNGLPVFNGLGDPSSASTFDPTGANAGSKQDGRVLLRNLMADDNYIMDNGYAAVSPEQVLLKSRSVFTFCRREDRSRSSESAIFTDMAMEMLESVVDKAQTGRIQVFLGGDYVYDEQINQAAVHDVIVMAGGLFLVGVFMTIHFHSLFLAFVVAFQIILSFSVTYYVYRVLCQVEQVPLLMLLGIFVIIGIGVDDAFVFYDHLRARMGMSSRPRRRSTRWP